jgi:hypothetical protein
LGAACFCTFICFFTATLARGFLAVAGASALTVVDRDAAQRSTREKVSSKAADREGIRTLPSL